MEKSYLILSSAIALTIGIGVSVRSSCGSASPIRIANAGIHARKPDPIPNSDFTVLEQFGDIHNRVATLGAPKFVPITSAQTAMTAPKRVTPQSVPLAVPAPTENQPTEESNPTSQDSDDSDDSGM